MTFIRTEPQHAGPNALGILIPQGTRTVVILRPRSLEWDLLPARWDGDHAHAPEFCTFDRDEAVQVARQLVAALESAVAERVCPVQTFGTADGDRCEIWLRTGELVWIVCCRAPGRAYQPMTFATLETATHAAEAIVPLVWPVAGTRQEYYFNTQKLK